MGPRTSQGLHNHDELAKPLRDALLAAGVRRVELHTNGKNRARIRAHDARGSFITVALAVGRSETWVCDRTGHASSVMLNHYRRPSRSASEVGLEWFTPLDEAIPELAAMAPAPMEDKR